MVKKTKKEKAKQIAKDIALGAVNAVGGLTGLGRVTQNTTLDKMSPEENARLAKQHWESSSFNKAHIPKKAGFADFEAARIKDTSDFTKLDAKLKAAANPADQAKTQAAAAVTAAVHKALVLSKHTKTAQTNFNDDIDHMEHAANEPKTKARASHMVTMAHNIKSEGHAAIAAQQATDQKEIDNLFNNLGFVQNLADSLGVQTNDPAIAQTKKEMLSELKASQKKELEAFDKSINYDSLIPMHDTAAAEAIRADNMRIAVLARMYENGSEKTKKMMNDRAAQLALNAQKPDKKADITVNANSTSAKFTGMKLTDFAELESITGRKVKVDPIGKDKNGNDIARFSIDLPNRILRADWYNSSHDNLKAEMKGIVDDVKTTNCTSIIMRLDHDDPEQAKKLARAAYEACIEGGFDPKDIELVVNGKKMTPDDAFAGGYSKQLQAANKKGEVYTQKTEAEEKRVKTGAALKQFTKDLRDRALDDVDRQKAARAIEDADDPTAQTMPGGTI